VNLKPFTAEAFRLPLKGTRAKVIRLVENNVLTESAVREVPVRSGLFDAAGSGFCKIAVVERHKGTGRIGLGILEGFGVENGAIAVSVAHDSHNVITAGDNDGDMYLSVKEIERLDGGLAVVSAGRVVKSVPLEVAGLMTAGGAAEFSRDFAEIARAAHALGVPEAVEPFMLLSFMSLSVIPHLKVTERGLFDADKFAFTDINAED
jgi:adenine deaminase